ncbi:MAG TPA: hypothetical protein VH853_23885 [Polyangia bacterium]|jgi:hypothetical protein|nr:hypothetical protein [Polyangia bacterium]
MKTKLSQRTFMAVPLALAVAFAAISCASTDMSSTWTDPSAKGAQLSKVAVICLAKDPGLRRMAENTAAANLTGAQAVPSYQVLGDTDLKNRGAVKEKLSSMGFQGVLVMRVASVNEQVTAVDGPYGTFDGYYDWAGAAVYAPGYLETDTVVHVVSNLYSLQDQKLIWSGVSQTFDPASAQSFMNDVSKAVAKSIEKDHLIL